MQNCHFTMYVDRSNLQPFSINSTVKTHNCYFSIQIGQIYVRFQLKALYKCNLLFYYAKRSNLRPFPTEQHCTNAKLLFYYVNRSNLRLFPIEQHCMTAKLLLCYINRSNFWLYPIEQHCKKRKIVIL